MDGMVSLTANSFSDRDLAYLAEVPGIPGIDFIVFPNTVLSKFDNRAERHLPGKMGRPKQEISDRLDTAIHQDMPIVWCLCKMDLPYIPLWPTEGVQLILNDPVQILN